MSIETGVKYRKADKFRQIEIIPIQKKGKKPSWLRVPLVINDNFKKVKKTLRENKLVTVCEEASCPNIHECFGNGVATFMIMGDICTRRCKFCDVAHGRPNPLDADEPKNLCKCYKKNLD